MTDGLARSTEKCYIISMTNQSVLHVICYVRVCCVFNLENYVKFLPQNR